MKNKKAVFLFGAGAVLDWGGPLTLCKRKSYEKIPDHGTNKVTNRPCCLTHLIINIGFVDKNGEHISNKIYKALKANKPDAYINFETIINVIEDLHNYWYARTSREINNIYGLIDIDDNLKDLHYFKVIPAQVAHLYSIDIPGNFALSDSDIKLIDINIDPRVKFYELLLNELLSGIIGHISKYSFASSSHKIIENPFNNTLNSTYGTWMKSFLNKELDIRLYTLNYDDIFKVLLEKQDVFVFDGFLKDIDENNYYSESSLKGIVMDEYQNIHYNLHGSAFWKVEELNENQLRGYRYLKYIPGLINDSGASTSIEKGKSILLSNIITGFQKVQKTAVAPFRQFFSALDKDCFEAEELFLIGYSFGDEHVNDIIRNSKRNNSDLKITLINPTFDDKALMFDFLSNWGDLKAPVYSNQSEDIILAKDFNVKIIKKRFGEFLKCFSENS